MNIIKPYNTFLIIIFFHAFLGFIYGQHSNDFTAFERDSLKMKKALTYVDSLQQTYVSNDIYKSSYIEGIKFVEIFNSVRYMVRHPNASLIGYNGNYCGPASIINWLLNNEPLIYAKTVLSLAQYGKSKVLYKDSRLKVPRYAKKLFLYRIEQKDGKIIRNHIDSTSIADFILTVSLVHSEKFIQRFGLLYKDASYNKESTGNFIYTNTMPWEMNDYFRKLGVKLESKHYYWGEKESVSELYFLQKAIKNGKLPVLFDNHLISYAGTENALYSLIGRHYITLHSIKINEAEQTVDYTYWDYGAVRQSPYLTNQRKPETTGNLKKDIKRIKRYKPMGKQQKSISFEAFLKGMKGYWIPITK